MTAELRRVIYTDELSLAKLEKESSVAFYHRGRLRTLRMPGNLWYKLRFCDDETLGKLMSDAAALGMKRDWWPSGFASVFHDAFPRPRPVGLSLKMMLPTSCGGAWQEALGGTGVHRGVREFDMNSAYGWAGFRQLPVVRTAEFVRKWSGPGIYLGKITRVGSVLLPPHLRNTKSQWLTHEEIDELGVHVAIERGVVFHKWWEPRVRLEKIIERVRSWKDVLRSYWGGWASTEGPLCKANGTGKTWKLPNILWDPVSAHFIVSRVRNRMAQHAKSAVHIFSDAIVTTERFPVGTGIGEWKMKNQFERMVVRSPGRWLGVTVTGKQVEKSSGGRIPLDLGGGKTVAL